PAPIRDLVAARVRRGPVPDQPALTREEQTRFFDNLLVTADANLQHALTTDRLEQANLNYWAYWVGEIGQVQVDDEFMGCVDPREWSGVRLLGHLLTRLHPGSGHTELNIHTVWALLLTHPLLLNNHADLGSAVANTVDDLAADHDLSRQARRELSDIAYATRLAHQ
ncbi:MAG: hypothetical protein ACRDRU_10310, partial [Pseudonocardiaceae bacterium]